MPIIGPPINVGGADANRDPGGSTPAVVVIADIPASDNFALFQTNDGEVWTDYIINSRYEKDYHRYMLGVSSPSPPTGIGSVAVVQLANPTLIRIDDWTAAKWNRQPEIPNPVSQDANWVLLDEIVEPAMVTLGPDGATPLYRISGTYVYAHLNPSTTTVNNVIFSRPPWLIDQVDRTMPSSKLTGGLTEAQQAPVKLPTFIGS